MSCCYSTTKRWLGTRPQNTLLLRLRGRYYGQLFSEIFPFDSLVSVIAQLFCDCGYSCSDEVCSPDHCILTAWGVGQGLDKLISLVCSRFSFIILVKLLLVFLIYHYSCGVFRSLYSSKLIFCSFLHVRGIFVRRHSTCQGPKNELENSTIEIILELLTLLQLVEAEKFLHTRR